MICTTFLLGNKNVSFYSQGFFEIRQEDVSISYLPLAHMFERMIQVNSVAGITYPLICTPIIINRQEVKSPNTGF